MKRPTASHSGFGDQLKPDRVISITSLERYENDRSKGYKVEGKSSEPPVYYKLECGIDAANLEVGGSYLPETRGGPFPGHLRAHEFTESCPACRTLLVNYLCCIFAGGAATSVLLPTEHAESQTTDDCKQIHDMLQKAFTTDEQQRKIVYGEAEQQAYGLISRESNAVRALAKELLDHGALWGCDAERIIRGHLGSG